MFWSHVPTDLVLTVLRGRFLVNSASLLDKLGELAQFSRHFQIDRGTQRVDLVFLGLCRLMENSTSQRTTRRVGSIWTIEFDF